MNLLELPTEIQMRVLSFLNTRSVVRFSESCRLLHERFPVTQICTSLPDQTIHGSYSDGDCYESVLKLFPFFSNGAESKRLRSMRLSCRWVDQGWGNRKGGVGVVARNDNDSNSRLQHNRNPASMGRLLCRTSEAAQHDEADLTLDFTSTPCAPHESCYLLMKAGGGGGHSLHLRQVQIQTVILDKPDRSLSKNYKRLTELGVLGMSGGQNSPFLFQVLQTAVQGLLQAMERFVPMDPTLVAFLQEQGFAVTKSSLESIQGLLRMWPAGMGHVELPGVATVESDHDY